MQDQDLWTPLLAPGETLVWTGRPSTGWHFRKTDWPIFFVAAANAGLPALVLLNGELREEAPGWFLGLMGFTMALGISLIPFQLWKTRRQRVQTRYALTDQRALILSVGSANKLRPFPLDETNRLDVVPYGKLASVMFKDEQLVVGNVTMAKRVPAEVGFEWIADADTVADHLRRLGAGQGQGKSGITWGNRT